MTKTKMRFFILIIAVSLIGFVVVNLPFQTSKSRPDTNTAVTDTANSEAETNNTSNQSGLTGGEDVPAKSLPLGLSNHTIEIGDDVRHYKFFAPNEDMSGRPIWMLLHGGNQSYTIVEDGSINGLSLQRLAEQENILLVVPNGTDKDTGAFDSQRNARWNDDRLELGGQPQDNGPLVEAVDDVAFLSQLIEYVNATYGTNESRVYVTGVSNGGYMAQKMLIEAPEQFAAGGAFISSVAEPMLANPPETPKPVFFWHGSEDSIVSYNGVDGVILSGEASAKWWASANGAGAPSAPEQLTSPDAKGCYTSLQVYPGSDPVYHYVSNGGGHILPSKTANIDSLFTRRTFGYQCADIDTLPVAWEFLSEQTM